MQAVSHHSRRLVVIVNKVSAAEVSSSTGRDAGSKNMVLGTDDSIDKWRQLDEKVW